MFFHCRILPVFVTVPPGGPKAGSQPRPHGTVISLDSINHLIFCTADEKIPHPEKDVLLNSLLLLGGEISPTLLSKDLVHMITMLVYSSGVQSNCAVNTGFKNARWPVKPSCDHSMQAHMNV